MDSSSCPSFSSSFEEPDWSLLPENVLFVIISELFLLSDMFSFGYVCRNWFSAFEERLKDLKILPNMILRRRLPMLLMPTDDCSENTRNLYSLPDKQVYDLKLLVPYNKRCIGSSHGWLMFIDSVSFVITLYNPFYFGSSKGTIHLPPFPPAEFTNETANADGYDLHSDYYICKAVLSADPSSSNNYFVMLIHGVTRSLAFYKSGKAKWSYFNQSAFYDVIYHQNYFLAVSFWGQVYTCDVNSDMKITRVTGPVSGPTGYLARRYLVELDDGKTILQVVRKAQRTASKHGHPFLDTMNFVVYKMQSVDGVNEWIPMASIGGGALFLGDNHSTYVKASDFPGIYRDSIYFTDDYVSHLSMFDKRYQFTGCSDSGIFLIEDGSFFSHHITRPVEQNLPPPIWILPTFK